MQTYGQAIDAAMLIPHMLEAFMARDRGFKKGGGWQGRTTENDLTTYSRSEGKSAAHRLRFCYPAGADLAALRRSQAFYCEAPMQHLA